MKKMCIQQLTVLCSNGFMSRGYAMKVHSGVTSEQMIFT